MFKFNSDPDLFCLSNCLRLKENTAFERLAPETLADTKMN